jgi:phage/plasmid-associated DNA primase
MTSDLIRDDDLVKRLDELIRDQRGVDADTLREVRGRLEALQREIECLRVALNSPDVRTVPKSAEALQAEVEKWKANFVLHDNDLHDAVASISYLQDAVSNADRRVEEEREACAKVAEHFTGSLWDADENALARRITDAIRSRSTREQVSDSSTACSTAASPISQEQGEIAPEALSEGGE